MGNGSPEFSASFRLLPRDCIRFTAPDALHALARDDVAHRHGGDPVRRRSKIAEEREY
jgi:hypothetical protein